MKYSQSEPHSRRDETGRLLRCIQMAMGCLDPLSKNRDERLAWHRLCCAFYGQEPYTNLEEAEANQ